MRRLLERVPEIVRTVLVFLVVLGCLFTACAVSVRAEVENAKQGETQDRELQEKTQNTGIEEEQEETDFLEKVREIEDRIMLAEGSSMPEDMMLMSSSPTVSEVLGMDGAVYLDWLNGHENDTYYLTTPYRPYDWRSPNGDPAFNGEPGMNCTGFVWHALMYPTHLCGGNTEIIPALTGWVTFYRTYNIQRQYFSTREEMLASGYLEKGDIIWMFDGSEEVLSDYHHVVIYWGDGHSDVCWQSIDGATDGNELAYDGNIISRITSKCASPYYLVLKTGGVEPPKTGILSIKKVSGNAEITDGNCSYSLAGAEYTVYREESCVTSIGILTTDENGESDTLELEAGDYWIKETKAPEGYLVNHTANVPDKVTVTAGQQTIYQSADIPQFAQISVLCKKVDAETGKVNAGLKGAEFMVEFYDGMYGSDPAGLGKSPLRSWVFRSDEKGEVLLSKAALVSGDALYYMDGKAGIPIGTVVIREKKAPAGYLKSEEIFVRKVSGETAAEVIAYNLPVVSEIPQKGVIELQKLDDETGQNRAQGGAALAGAVYEVYDSKKNLVQLLITDEQGKACTKELPFGSYTVKEKKASPGYLLNQEEIRVELKPSNEFDRVFYAAAVSREKIIRGDLELTKIGGGDTEHIRLAGVPFLITSKTTGEQHTVVTDRNGYASTESSWNPHSQNTNRGETDKDGVWFGAESVQEEAGALPYDTYLIQELECERNQGYQLIEPFEMVIERDKRTVDLDTLTDIKKISPRIGTTALIKETGTQEGTAEGKITIVDTVTYEHLQAGKEYVVKGIVMDKETGKPFLSGQEEVTAEKAFRPSVSTGTVGMEFHFDAAGVGEKTLVVFETVYQGEQKIAEHEDLEDEGQTIRLTEKPEEPEEPQEPEPEEPESPEPEEPGKEKTRESTKTVRTGDDGVSLRDVAALICVELVLGAAAAVLKRKERRQKQSCDSERK